MHHKIKMVKRMIALIFIASVLSMPVSATEVVINDASAYHSNITFTYITLENATNVGVIDLNLSYNPSTVIVTDVKDGECEFDVIIPNLVKNSTGFVRIGAFQIENPGLNGPVVIANLTLKAEGDPSSTSPLNITVNELTDATNKTNDIPYTIINGTFTVTASGEQPTPMPTPPPSNDRDSSSGGGYVPTTPTPTEKPPAVGDVAATSSPTLAPTVTPPTATPAQTPAPTTPAAQVPVMRWFMILMVIFISVIIVLTGYLLIRKMS